MSGALLIKLRPTDKNSKLVSLAPDYHIGASFCAPNRLLLIMAASLDLESVASELSINSNDE